MNYANDFTALELLAAQYFSGRSCKLIPYLLGVTMPSTIAAGDVGLGYQRVPANMAGLLVVALTIAHDTIDSFQPFRLQITDTGSQERYFNSPVPALSVAGCLVISGNGQSNLTVPRLIAGNTQIEVALYNDSGADSTGSEVVFHGVGVYLMG